MVWKYILEDMMPNRNDGLNDKGYTTGSSDGLHSSTKPIDSMNESKALHILDLGPSATADEAQMAFISIIEELSEHPSYSMAERAIAMAKAVSFIKNHNQVIAEFSEKYDYFLTASQQMLVKYPQFKTNLDRLSNEFYVLCSQFVLGTQKSEADINQLTETFSKDIEALLLSINAEFRNATDDINMAFRNVAATHDYTERDKDWGDMMDVLTYSIQDIILYVLSKGRDAESRYPLNIFKDAYEAFKIKMDLEVDVPEHRVIIKKLMQLVSQIGSEYFLGLEDRSADVFALSKAYKDKLNQALTDIEKEFEKAGAEQAEIWPNLRPTLKILATIVFVVGLYILITDNRISKNNALFRSEKAAFKHQISIWLTEIPMLDQKKYAQKNEGFRDSM